VVGLSAVVAVLIVVLGVGLILTALLRQERDRALVSQARAERAEREVELLSHLRQATALRRSRAGGQRFKCLEEIAQALQLNPSQKLRHQLRIEAIGALALPDLHLARQWDGFPPGSYGVDFDDRLEIYVRTDQQGNCSVRKVAGDQRIVLLPGWGKPARPQLSRDGRFVAMLGEHGRLEVWKLAGSQSKIVLKEVTAPVFKVDFRADSRQLALAYFWDGAIRVHELPTGHELHRLEPSEKNRRHIGVALHPTDPVVAVYSYVHHRLQLRDLVTGKVQAEVDHAPGFVHAAWSPDGRTLAVGGGNDERIFLYDRHLNLVRSLVTRGSGVYVAFNHAGDRLVSTGWGGNVQLWDVVVGRLLFTLPGNIGTSALRFSQDDQWLAGPLSGNKLGIWKVGDGRDYRTLSRDGLPRDVHFSSPAVGGKKGHLLAVAMGNSVGFWNLETGAQLPALTRPGVVRQVLFEPSGTLLTLEPGLGVYRWAVPAGFGTPGGPHLEAPQSLAFPERGYAIAQSRDGRVLAMSVRNTIGNAEWAGLWVLHADRPGPPRRFDAEEAAHIAVCRDGRWVAAAIHLDDTIKIWEARTGRLVRQLKQGGGAGFCQFSPNGKWLATGLDGNRLWAVDVEPWAEGPRLRPGDGVASVFSPDSKLIAHDANNGAVRLVEAASGREIIQLPDPRLESALPLFTPDGTRLITLTNGNVPGIHIWDLRSIRRQLAKMGLDWE
jgi:hypothetical protein